MKADYSTGASCLLPIGKDDEWEQVSLLLSYLHEGANRDTVSALMHILLLTQWAIFWDINHALPLFLPVFGHFVFGLLAILFTMWLNTNCK